LSRILMSTMRRLGVCLVHWVKSQWRREVCRLSFRISREDYGSAIGRQV